MNFNPNSSMNSKQLIDSLTSHISLYHSSNPDIDPSPNPRSSILKWFSSLTVHQRQASITIVDSSFTQLVVRMLRKSQSQGHGFFIVLPDLLSDDLPTICFRKSHGLLSRIAESDYTERVVYESILLFSSKEGEHVSPRSCSERSLDTVSVCEEFVGNVDKFVAVMDAVSSGRFLRGEESELGSDWVELKWLKAKGYYNMEAFLVNRMEVALRLAWFNCSGGGGKKRGVTFKEKANAAGVAANVLWRKKGCVDWWDRLNSDVRRKMLISMLGKASKAMTQEFLKEGDNALGEAMCLCGASREQLLKNSHNKLCQMAIKIPLRDADEGLATSLASIFDNPTPLTNIYGSLFVLWSICSVMFACLSGDYSRDKIFYSTLDSITTISDCITRKLRGLLMAVSLNCTEIELLGEGNSKSPSSKGQEKAGNSSTRKKGNTRNLNRLNAETRLHGGDCKLNVSCKDHKGASAQIVESKRTDGVLHAEALHRESLSSLVEKEHSEGFDGKVSKCARKVRKGKNKNRTPGLHDSPKHQKLKNYSPCVASEGDVVTNRNLLGSSNIVSNSRPDSTTNGCSSLEGTNVQSSCGDLVSASSNNGCHAGADFVDDAADGVTNTRTMVSKAEISDCMASGNEIAPQLGVMDFDGVLSTEDSNSLKPGHASDIDKKIPHQVFNLKEETCQAKECGTGPASYSQCLSYEWPSVAPVNFSLASSHLPAATDRLHLDVGHNWCNHLHQSFMPAIHQARNSSIQTGRSHILTHQIPNGSDWPPIVRGANTIDSSVICNYDSGFISRHQSSFPQAFTIHNSQLNSTTMEDERKCYGDLTELSDVGNLQEISDVGDSQWISDDEYEVHTVSRMDYNQYFGGGVMYWNPTDHLGTGFSRPPSLSSDDSSWAWRDAEMKKDVDDMVAFPSSYSTNGLASPTAASLCSAFDCLGTGLGYIMPGKEVTGSAMLSLSTVTDAVADHRISSSLASKTSDVERNADLLPQSILRPITIPSMSRKTSRSEFKRAHDHTSPCVPPTRREQPRIKRPPSPVVLCVPRTHCPPRPCPVSDSRKHRGLPTVRSGSSSPRNWSTRDSYGEGTGFEESSVRMDGTGVFWPSWRSDNFSACPLIQPLAGALLQDHLIALSQMALDPEHPDVGFPLEPSDLSNCAARKASLSLMQNLLHDEIDSFCKLVAAENLIRKRYINWAVKRVARSLQVLWPRSRTNIFGSIATGLSLPSSDVDLVVCLPPVRNLEPIKEAGILEGRNGIKETCLQHAARYLANQEWVKNDSLKTVENTAIPIIMLVVEVPLDLVRSTPNIQIPDGEPTQKAGTKGKDVPAGMVGLKNSATSKCLLVQHDGEKNFKSLHLDISFKSPSHTGLQTTEMVKELIKQFPATAPLALVLKKFLADRSLDQSYSGGLSSYCLVLLITRFLQHEHHLGRPINQNYGRLLMDFLYFFGNVFDPRQMGVAVQGSGVYLKRERGSSIDPIHIDDPLFPTNNVGRNCFRIHQCIKAFSDAYSVLENELACLLSGRDADEKTQYRLLPKIIQSIDLL